MNAAEIIERAADIMQERGKATGRYEDEAGRVCVYGAINAACGLAALTETFVGPQEAAKSAVFNTFGGPATWNDANDAPTVIAGLRAVAATLRAQQAAPVAAPVYAEMES